MALVLVAIIAGCHTKHLVDNRISAEMGSISPRQQYLIDSVVNDAISQRAMPGCRILAVRNRKIILNKSYGYLTYDSLQPVNDSTLYDLASVTKLAASSLLMMKLYDDGKIDLDLPLTSYFRGIMDNGATLRDALAHQAGFKPWLDLRRRHRDIATRVADGSPLDVAQSQREIIQSIVGEDLNPVGQYQYSDLGFFMYPLFAKKFYGLQFQDFLAERFYHPLGIGARFCPLSSSPHDANIAPTENDTIWRHRIVRGTVHDEGAAMMGGVSGHAGLFATAGDMAVIMQMLLNKGEYGDIRYLKPETVELFTSQAFPGNRRGLVFDKPLLDTAINGTPSKMASPRSFGHTGFTGTFVWADPDNGLILVFLCNSCYPSRGTMLSRLNVRTQIHDILYKE